MGAAGDTDYDGAGPGYTRHRRPDPRIAARILAALGSARSIVNVGAGPGSYEPADRFVVAVEPSTVMRSQRPPGSAPVVDAVAQALPFADRSVDAVMALSTVHQWHDKERGLRELRRVARGPVVVFTFDPDAVRRFWITEYGPELPTREAQRVPPPAWVASVLGGRTSIVDIAIPLDCTDGFVEAYYGRPEAFLDPEVRCCQSMWDAIGPEAEALAVTRLEEALASGEWDRRHGHLRTQPTYDGSLRLVVSEP